MRNTIMFTAITVLALATTQASAGDVLFQPSHAAITKALDADESWQALQANPTSERITLVTADATALKAEAESLSLAIDGATVAAYRLDSYVDGIGNLVWSGIIEDTSAKLLPVVPDYTGGVETATDPDNQVLLVRSDDTVTGTIRLDGALYKIRPLTSGGHALVKIDESKLPPDHPPSFASQSGIPMAIGEPTLHANATIRVMVNYTPGAASQAGNISGLISTAVAESNQGYANSGVAITMVLANASQVSYTETGNFTTDLNRYRISRARALLETSPRSVTEIALAVGFADLAHFSRTFHREVGVTPNAYRRARQR